MRPTQIATLAAFVFAALAAGCASTDRGIVDSSGRPGAATIRVTLPAGSADVDVYWPASHEPAPLLIIAHGFSRDRHHMSGWGRELAAEGFVVAVPDLPAFSNHERNGRFIAELLAFLRDEQFARGRVDPSRVGLAGFSAGGLSSLLAAAGDSPISIWIGLDPVDRGGIGAKAAARVTARAVVLTAEPSGCNAHGNARGIIAALPRVEHTAVDGAVHVDAEWPTSRMAEMLCGRSTKEKREAFREVAVRALREAFGMATTANAPE